MEVSIHIISDLYLLATYLHVAQPFLDLADRISAIAPEGTPYPSRRVGIHVHEYSVLMLGWYLLLVAVALGGSAITGSKPVLASVCEGGRYWSNLKKAWVGSPSNIPGSRALKRALEAVGLAGASEPVSPSYGSLGRIWGPKHLHCRSGNTRLMSIFFAEPRFPRNKGQQSPQLYILPSPVHLEGNARDSSL